jgi:hypothetical protein
MKMWQKFALVGGFVLLLFGLPFSLYLKSINADVEFVTLERQGSEAIPYAVKVMQLAQKHRGLNSSVLNGASDLNATLNATGTELNSAFDTLQSEIKKRPKLQADESVTQLSNKWKLLLSERSQLTSSDSFTRHTNLVKDMLNLVDKIADNSGLTFSPDSASYFLMLMTTDSMLNLNENLATARGLGAALLSKGSLSLQEKGSLLGHQKWHRKK